MRVEKTEIDDVLLLEPHRHRDQRGFLSETYNEQTLADLGVTPRFVQENHVYSARQGTVRGLHFQVSPRPAAKLVRVVRGSIFDVAVDLRRGLPSFGSHVTALLSAENWLQMFIPEGFAHGFCTLEASTEVVYMTSAHWSPEVDRGLRWDDPDLAIPWPIEPKHVTVSAKDQRQPLLAELESEL